MTVDELRDSVAFSAGISYERRRMIERLRQRAAQLHALEQGPVARGARTTATELRRVAAELEALA